MLKLWDIVLVFVSNEITVEHPLISAQPTTTNIVEYITSPAKQHIPQRRTAAWPGGVEREEGSMAFATMNASPPRKNARSQSVPPGKGTPPTAKVRTSDARQCTISSTILSLILSIIPSLVYYKKHTSNLLTLKSESGILWSS